MEMMKKSNKIRALSLMELMILIISLALIIAFSAPLISKKVLSKADIASHGVYICYRDNNNQLWEVQYRDKKMEHQLYKPRRTDSCTFKLPKKNALYQVTSIGGGGGGGDAGYLGGMKRSDWKLVQDLGPDNLNSTTLLKNYNIDIEEFLGEKPGFNNKKRDYSGQIYFYALGAFGTESGKFLVEKETQKNGESCINRNNCTHIVPGGCAQYCDD